MPFVKGQSGNPKGRTPGSISLVDILRRKLGEVPPGTDNTRAEALVDAYLADVMLKPDLKKDVFDRIDGKPKNSPEDPGSPDNPIQHEHRVIWE